jgi:hypothetical protein
MATYNHLPVYKQTYDLLLQLFRVCQNMERDFKFTLGENLKKEVIELIIHVYRANSRNDKTVLLESARENIEVVRLLLRLLQDLKQIGLNEFVLANEKIESVSKQLSAWQHSQSKGTKPKAFEGQSSEGLLAFPESAG